MGGHERAQVTMEKIQGWYAGVKMFLQKEILIMRNSCQIHGGREWISLTGQGWKSSGSRWCSTCVSGGNKQQNSDNSNGGFQRLWGIYAAHDFVSRRANS